jgi:ferredoxin
MYRWPGRRPIVRHDNSFRRIIRTVVGARLRFRIHDKRNGLAFARIAHREGRYRGIRVGLKRQRRWTDLPFGEKAMARLEFNDEPIEAREGETLVRAARRHGSYVWFLCDGKGICQTCECRVISGAENLSEVSELERVGLGEHRRQRGYRLGCQARLVGSGLVSVVSRAEELRRRARDVLLGSKGRSLWERLQDLSGDSLSATVDLLTGVTSASPHAVPQLVKYPPTPARVVDYVRDTMRLAGRLWSGGRGADHKNSHSKS